MEIVKICYEVGDWEGLNANIVLISKRRQQLKQVLVEIVQASLHDEKIYIFRPPFFSRGGNENRH